MFVHPIKKLLGLTVLYSVIIVGIFVLQFKSETAISGTVGDLRYSLAQATDAQRQTVLKNSMEVSFKGLQFTADKNHPLVLLENGRRSGEHLTLISYQNASPSSITFSFTQDVELTFLVSGSAQESELSVRAKLPDGADALQLYCTVTRGHSVTPLTGSLFTVETQSQAYELAAAELSGGKPSATITFTKDNPLLSYTRVVEQQGFTMDKAAQLALADRSLYEQTMQKLSAKIIEDFTAAVRNDSQLSELSVMAYVSAMAQASKYEQALDFIPASFKNSRRRTYLTAPYFGTLTQVYRSFSSRLESFRSMADEAVQTKSCAVFAQENLSSYIIQNYGSPRVTALLALPAELEEPPTTVQAMGILRVYTELAESNKSMAAPLEPVIQTCLDVLTKACLLDQNNTVKLYTEEQTEMQPLDAIATGDTLIRYGNLMQKQEAQLFGYAVINSYFTDFSRYDLFTLSEAYPLVSRTSWYPHMAVINTQNGQTITAWTCASSISSRTDGAGTMTLSIDFPTGLSHYLIISGIPQFKRIQIYGMDFRTDPRFETYNSSGYVYVADQRTLLLKSRHRSQVERVSIITDSTENS